MVVNRNHSPQVDMQSKNCPLYVDLKEFQALSGLPFRSIERLIESKRLNAVVVGKKRLIHRSELKRLESLVGSGGSPLTTSNQEVANDNQ